MLVLDEALTVRKVRHAAGRVEYKLPTVKPRNFCIQLVSYPLGAFFATKLPQ